jgi:hypothetical protein
MEYYNPDGLIMFEIYTPFYAQSTNMELRSYFTASNFANYACPEFCVVYWMKMEKHMSRFPSMTMKSSKHGENLQHTINFFLMSTTEELLGRKSSGSGLEN